jgi:tetratricopeptide (TPR) repeat protein/predicted Ser/Thr protein kinase
MPSDSPGWDEVRRQLGELVELSPEVRRERLAALSPTVRTEVQSLIDALDASPGFLNLSDTPQIPDSIGPYRVLGEIGRGGMGVVYRAERADREVVRQVAIKLAGGPMFAPEAERRFIRERQILATLDHPHIVRLLDGGIARGQRYFVMELVEGLPFTDYARERPLADRLRVFVDVCSAIHYAHQRLVLHRDLKPGNILVSRDGQVKVLDFGIAHIVQGDSPVGAVTTMVHPLSFACASPEQLRGEPLSLTSDVYSLGVLLYEVATGHNPRYRPDASVDENLRRALDEDVLPPSRAASGLPRDLDAIALKALARRPENRYASVAELQADLERLLQGRPVQAIPPRPGYVIRRFVARNKLLTTAAALLVAAVLTSAAIYIRQSRIEQRRFEDARRLVHTVVFDIQPRLESIPATLPLRKTLIEETLRYLEAVSRDVGNNVSLLRELANSYAQLATIQGGDALAANLGDRRAAATLFDQASELMGRAMTLAAGDPDALVDASTLSRRRSDFALQGENRGDAHSLAEQAVALAEQALARGAGTQAREALALAWFSRGRALLNPDPDAALAQFDRARGHFTEAAAQGTTPPREAGLIEQYTSDLLIKRGDKSRAPQHAREALRILKEVLAARPNDSIAQMDVAVAEGQLASVLYNSGDESGSVPHFKASADMRERIVAADPANVRARERLALAKGRLGTILARAGDFPGALAMLNRSVSLYEGLQAANQLAPTMEADFAEVLGHVGDYHQRVNEPQKACAAFGRGAALLKAADARVPLTAFRKEMLESDLNELARCR